MLRNSSPLRVVNANVVLQDQVLSGGCVQIENGMIRNIEALAEGTAADYDIEGSWLLPGIVDIHSDAIEKWAEPRPQVRFPFGLALSQADSINAISGITTPFHSISFATDELGLRNPAEAYQLVRELHTFRKLALVDHKIHCRYEVTDPASPAYIRRLVGDGMVDLLSFMDHTPGHGQFGDVSSYRAFLLRTYELSSQEADHCIGAKKANTAGAPQRVADLAKLARSRTVTMAAHDEYDPASIPRLREMGVSLCEFPINLETARAAHAAGMQTIVGAANLIRGRSQSGALRAADAIEAGVAHCICSDYSPCALLHAVFQLPELTGISLPAAVRLATANPARAAGLGDRGEIAAGQKADLIAVARSGEHLAVRDVWVKGRHILRYGYSQA